MKVQIDDSNVEGMISKLAKGSIEEKSYCLKRLFNLYLNSRSRIYLYERRITESLQLSLLIEEKDISLNALSLLQKIIVNTSAESEIINIIKKRLLSKIVLNLGSIEITIRKISHKCILEYVRKFRDYEAVTAVYLKTAIQQADNLHLKLKAINSYQSLLMGEAKYFNHLNDSSRLLVEELIHSSFQKDHSEIRRAALLCLIFLLKIQGSQENLRNLSPDIENELMQLRFENEELSNLLDMILKDKSDQVKSEQQSQPQNNTPSPKFISIQDTQELKIMKAEPDEPDTQTIPDTQLKIFNQVSYAEEFLKRLQKTANWQFQEIQEFAPFLEKCFNDQNIKLFSISKKIVQVIFNSDGGRKKEYYVVLVPCVVNGIGNKRFLVRKNIDKLVRQYIKNHTEVWISNFIERFAVTKNPKIKELLIEFLMHAFKSSPEFYYPVERTFEVFDMEITDTNSSLKRKVIDCIVLILERQGKDEKEREEMLQVFSADPYNKIIRKMGKTNKSLGSYSEEMESRTPETMDPVSPMLQRKDRKNRLVTVEPEKRTSVDKSHEQRKSHERQKSPEQDKSQQQERSQQIDKNDNGSQGKKNQTSFLCKEKRVRNSQIEINFRQRKGERRSKDQKTSLERLPQLKKVKNTSTSKHDINESPVKKSIGQKNIVYVQHDQMVPLQNPKNELESALNQLTDSNWNIKFQSINKIRAIIQYHKQLINDECLAYIVGELLQCLNNLRSGVAKLALMCLGELMRAFHKRMYSFTDSIILCVMKRSITTSQFMQDEIRKCIVTCAEELCIGRIIASLNSMRDSKSAEIKLTLLLFVQVLIRNEKHYKKECEWIWTIVIEFHEQPQFNLRSQCKRLVKIILELYKDWKNDVMQLKKQNLERIDKILKNLNAKGENLWIEIENLEFEKALISKVMTSKYFSASYTRFQELDKAYTLKKSWKERIKLLNDLFQSAFQHPAQFQANTNAKKYIQVACEHIDEKNPGLLLNSLMQLMRSIDCFPNVVQECIGQILEKCVIVIDTRRAELVAMASKMLHKISCKYDINKILKEYLKLCLANPNRIKAEIMNQIIALLKEQDHRDPADSVSIRDINADRGNASEPAIMTSSQNLLARPGGAGDLVISSNSQNMLVKSLIKLCSDRSNENSQAVTSKLKDLFSVCQRRFGQEFTSKVMANDRAVDLLA